jgi:hypothetical protein
MPQSLITQVSQKLSIAGVKDIEVTGIVDDGAGGWLRAVRYYGTPTEGTQESCSPEPLMCDDACTANEPSPAPCVEE